MDTSEHAMWVPSADLIANANVTAFTRWVNSRHQLSLGCYSELWQWSIADIDRFWLAIWDFFELPPQPSGPALARAVMPGAQWFPGRTLNYAEQVLTRAPSDGPAILYFDQALNERSLSRDELSAAVLQLADAMRRAGIVMGDRVVACMPNCPETMIAMLATASVGAIWSVVSPETGADGMLARFAQLEPRLLFAVDGYGFKGAVIDRCREIRKVVAGLPTLKHVVILPKGLPDPLDGLGVPTTRWSEFTAQGSSCAGVQAFDFPRVPVDHPLWILFSSGTTGLPKAMVHSHGGVLLEQLKCGTLHLDLRPGDRMFFYTITGWMVWNVLLGAMLAGATSILYDEHPTEPIGQLWNVAEKSKATLFGGSPSYVKLLMQAGYRPGREHDLPALRAILLSGSPASPECMRWFLEAVKPDLWVQSACGGTDVCTSFVGGVPTLPVFAGEIQARWLGVDAVALDDDGNVVVGDVGELVIRQPMPSMPVLFWNDAGNKRYCETYFDTYPGLWRQGDFVLFNSRGGAHVLGRSDATLNRHGVRIGTAEIYRSLEELREIADALVVNVDLPGGDFWMPLLVRLAQGVTLDAALEERIRQHLKTSLSPRHIPDDVIAIPGIPYTRTGKRLEVPLRRVLSGTPIEKAVAKEATEDFSLLLTVIDIARERMVKRTRLRPGAGPATIRSNGLR